MLDIRDWRPYLGQIGKLHVRFGKGSRGRGIKPRLIPAINGAAELIDWWLAEVRPQFVEDWSNPDASMLPSERIDHEFGRAVRVGPNAYFSQGRCELCLPGSPRNPGSCKDCLSWGVYRQNNWLYSACRWWR